MGRVKKGGKGISHPWAVSRRVGKGFPTHGSCQEGWERDFPPTDRVKKGGKGISHPSCQEGWERDFLPMGRVPPTDRVKKGGKGISRPRIVSRRVGKGFPTHGPCQEGWERDFPPTDRVKKGGKGISYPRIGLLWGLRWGRMLRLRFLVLDLLLEGLDLC